MNYYTDLFSPETYEAFTNSDRTVSGFRLSQRLTAGRIEIGDRFICYLTRLSRWVGVLEVVSRVYEDDSPIFYEEQDPFVVRFKVKTLAWLDKEKALPIHQEGIWNSLSFTRDYDPSSSTWTGKVRRSLNVLSKEDGQYLEQAILGQTQSNREFSVDEQEYQKLLSHRIRTADKIINVTVPETPLEGESSTSSASDVRESIKIQALIASIGAKMGFKIWLPKGDRGGVLAECGSEPFPVLDVLPLNYDDTTLKTIERIDVLWLKGRMIVRAFEVEHTTSIYSGMLRMADLLALQPNMAINLHIVAPSGRREKVFQELRRPVFSLLDKGPLADSCTYISYESLRELSELPHIGHTSDSILDEYGEVAE
jgi:hypothetical protein